MDHDVDHAAGYERFLLWMYLAWRAISVLVYGAATKEARSSFRRPRVAEAAWVLMTGEFAWSTWRLLRGGPPRGAPVTGWVDTAASAVVLGFFPRALEPGDTDQWRAWHVSQALAQAEATPFLFHGRAHRVAATSVLIASHAAGRALAPDPLEWGEVARTGAAMAFRCLWTSLFANVVRDNVKRLDDAHASAVRAAEDAALRRSRARHRRYLQDRAVQVLESISLAEQPRAPVLRLAANREAGRLRRLLLPGDGLRPELAVVVEEAAELGIDLEVVSGDVDIGLQPAAVDGIRAEVAAAAREMTHLDTPTGSVRHVVLFVDLVGDTVVATLRGSGVRREVRVAL